MISWRYEGCSKILVCAPLDSWDDYESSGTKAWYPWDVKPPFLTMVFPKKSRKKWGKTCKTHWQVSVIFIFTPTCYVSCFPPSRKFVPTHSKAAANIDVYTFPGDFNHQVSRNFLFSARLRAKDACCHEEEPLQVFKKRLKSLFEVNLPEAATSCLDGGENSVSIGNI